MHLEILVEDSSGATFLSTILPKLLKNRENSITWKIHSYKGIGQIPKGLQPRSDPQKRILLDQLKRLLQGYGKTPGIDSVVVVLDSDKRNCKDFLNELKLHERSCEHHPPTMFRLAIEEIESWYLGDQDALLAAYPKAKKSVLQRYQQDSACGTWEILADAIYPGGSAAILKKGWPAPGQFKQDLAQKIAPFLDPEKNKSPSFQKLREGLHRLTANSPGIKAP